MDITICLWAAIRRGDESNPMVEHMGEHHPGEEARFQMRVVSIHKSPLVRQSEEGRMIDSYKGDLQLNRKGEWGNNLSPNLMVEEVGPQKRKGRQETQQERPQAKKPRGAVDTVVTGVAEVYEMAQEGAFAPGAQAHGKEGKGAEKAGVKVGVNDKISQPEVSQMTKDQVPGSRRQDKETKEAAGQAGAMGDRKAGRQLTLKEILRRLGQEGRKKVVEEKQEEISLALESQPGQDMIEKQKVTRVDTLTARQENNILEDQLIPGLVTTDRHTRSVGSDISPSKKIIRERGKVHADAYKRNQIPSQTHKPLNNQAKTVDSIGILTSEEDGRRRGSRSPPGVRGNPSPDRKC